MEPSLRVMRQAADLVAAGRPFALCTVTSVNADGDRDRRRRRPRGEGEGARPPVPGRPNESKRPVDLACFRPGGLDSLCGGSVEIFVEYAAARAHVLVCGGGHVGLEVARLCDQLEYGDSVLDDRPEYASAERAERLSCATDGRLYIPSFQTQYCG